MVRKMAEQIESALGLLLTPSEYNEKMDRDAEYQILAFDNYGQMFIPMGIIVTKSSNGEIKAYDAEDYMFDLDKFLKGKETIIDGEVMYILPREIKFIVQMPSVETVKRKLEEIEEGATENV